MKINIEEFYGSFYKERYSKILLLKSRYGPDYTPFDHDYAKVMASKNAWLMLVCARTLDMISTDDLIDLIEEIVTNAASMFKAKGNKFVLPGAVNIVRFIRAVVYGHYTKEQAVQVYDYHVRFVEEHCDSREVQMSVTRSKEVTHYIKILCTKAENLYTMVSRNEVHDLFVSNRLRPVVKTDKDVQLLNCLYFLTSFPHGKVMNTRKAIVWLKKRIPKDWQ